ncbi:hypothetical protein [Streptomyces sp. NPDC058374]|uniref:hypothetical protein n=1 Tax=Streptomyces sp. NPDC058374 TaxID=3346466 RepID=UPI0036595E30
MMLGTASATLVEGQNLFGEGLTVTGSDTRQTAPGQVRVTLSTDRGEIIGAWPERELACAWAADTRGRPGPLDDPGAMATADHNLNEYLPADAPGPDIHRQALTLGGDDTHGPTAYLVSHGNTAPGAASSLDATLSADGRLSGPLTHPHPVDDEQPTP